MKKDFLNFCQLAFVTPFSTTLFVCQLLPLVGKALNLWFAIPDTKILKGKTLWPLLIDVVQLSQGYRATTRRQFSFYTESLGVLDTPLIDHGKMASWFNLGATQWF